MECTTPRVNLNANSDSDNNDVSTGPSVVTNGNDSGGTVDNAGGCIC